LEVVILQGIRDGHCTCRRGADCDSPGKHPYTDHELKQGVSAATSDVALIKTRYGRAPWANVGLACTNFWVIDKDPRHGGDRTWAALELGHDKLPPTPRVLTGGGGEHVYLQPCGGVRNDSSGVLFGSGIDVKATGGYVVVPPSLHISGQRYRWHPDYCIGQVPIAEPPTWIRTLLAANASTAVPPPKAGKRLVALIIEPRFEGHRTSTLVTISNYFLYHRVSTEPLAALMLHWNAGCCRPPLRPDVVMQTVRSMPARGGSGGGAAMANDAAPPPGVDWTRALQPARAGGYLGNEFNCCLALEQAPEFKGKLGYDLWHHRIEILASCKAGDPGPWQDDNVTKTACWLQSCGIQAPRGTVAAAVELVARGNAFNPVLDYFGSLTWDETPRVDEWLITYCRAVDTEVVRLIAAKFLLSLVARAYQPGCCVDHMLVLEGRQGLGKSTVAAILGGAWHSQDLPDFHSKDAQMVAGSYLVVEIPDLAAFPRSEQEHIKAFVTRTADTFRAPYARYPVTRPRACVFVATHNPTGAGYLPDLTGNRRYWPVAIGEADTMLLAQDRDQVLAEAAHRYRQGEKWWVEDEEQRLLLEAEQEKRVIGEPWEDVVGKWAADQDEPFTVQEAATGALGMEDVTSTMGWSYASVPSSPGSAAPNTRARAAAAGSDSTLDPGWPGHDQLHSARSHSPSPKPFICARAE
jgi:hypothetical protein